MRINPDSTEFFKKLSYILVYFVKKKISVTILTLAQYSWNKRYVTIAILILIKVYQNKCSSHYSYFDFDTGIDVQVTVAILTVVQDSKT